MAAQRTREEDEESSGWSLMKILGGIAIGSAALYMGASVAKELKMEEAQQYCSSNKLDMRIVYADEGQSNVLCSMEAVKIEVSLVFTPVFLLEKPEYAHVALKFKFNYHGRPITLFVAGVCSDKAHVLEPEVSFIPPKNIFETIECGTILMAPFALMKMCEKNSCNNTPYDIEQNNCYVWALNYGLMLNNDECGRKIVSIIKQLRNKQNKFIVKLGDIGHICQFPASSASFNSSSF